MSLSRYTAQIAVEKIGGNRFDLIFAIANRAREIHNGSAPKVKTDVVSHGLIALEEIDQGLIGEEYIAKFVKVKERRYEHKAKS